MALDFSIREFFLPITLWKMRRRFAINQWRDPKSVAEDQFSRLVKILSHSYDQVEYYRAVMDERKLTPSSFRSLEDLKKLPYLTKDLLVRDYSRLIARNWRSFHPRVATSSGTTGRKVKFLIDRSANALEFSYYWRYWGWSGYRLRDPFAEFATVFFLNRPQLRGRSYHYQRLANRLLLNGIVMNAARVKAWCHKLEKKPVSFLKGFPSTLYIFCKLVREQRLSPPRIRTVFTTGETLLDYQRSYIENTLEAPVRDSYGQMERLVTISECPAGNRHLNSDYGIAEFIPSTDFPNLYEIVGTSLHNQSMPLLRYRTGDLVASPPADIDCPCGRRFPVVGKIHGRQNDFLITAEGGFVTAAFLALEEVEGIRSCYLTQAKPGEVNVVVTPGPEFSSKSEARLKRCLSKRLGSGTDINIEKKSFGGDLQDPTPSYEKFRLIRSTIHL